MILEQGEFATAKTSLWTVYVESTATDTCESCIFSNAKWKSLNQWVVDTLERAV